MMRIGVALLVITTLASSSASAQESATQESRPGSPVDVKLAVDLPVTLGSAAAAAVPLVFRSEVASPACGLSCDPSNVNALDRTVIGHYSSGAGLASDILFGAAIGVPVTLDLIDVLVTRPDDGFIGYGKDMLVLAEVAAMDNFINVLAKYAVRRPRPLAYDTGVDPATRTSSDAGLSFYSGHASTSFALATAYSYLFMKRHPHSKLVVPVWLGTCLLAATISVLRVESGNHFWTDVLVGGAVGSGVGLLVTQLHRRRDLLGDGGRGYTFRVVPTALPGGGGLTLSVTDW